MQIIRKPASERINVRIICTEGGITCYAQYTRSLIADCGLQ